MSHDHFFDIPVYRLAQDTYYAARQDHVDALVYQVGSTSETFLREKERVDPNAHVSFRSHLQQSYGGCWEFNEIIGYIRLHFLGTQVRGEYFASTKSRLVRTRTKTLEWKTWKLAPEVDIDPPYGTAEVLHAVRSYISDCKKQLPRRYIDDEHFEVIAPYVDWAALFQSAA